MHHRRAHASVNTISANIVSETIQQIITCKYSILTTEQKIYFCGYQPICVYVSAITEDTVKIDILPENKPKLLKIDHSDFD